MYGGTFALPRAQRAGHGRADAGRLEPDRKQIAGHHVVLGLEMHRAELGFVGQAAQHRAVVHHRGHVLQALRRAAGRRPRWESTGRCPAVRSPSCPASKGVCCLGSQVSVCAMPPGSQMKITASALAASWPRRRRVGRQQRRRAAAAEPRSAAPASERVDELSAIDAVVMASALATLLDVLKLGTANQRPEDVFQAFAGRFGGLAGSRGRRSSRPRVAGRLSAARYSRSTSLRGSCLAAGVGEHGVGVDQLVQLGAVEQLQGLHHGHVVGPGGADFVARGRPAQRARQARSSGCRGSSARRG